MSLRLYIDHNVRGEIVAGLRARGVDVLTAREDGRADRADAELIDRATLLGRVMFSQDRDMLVLAAQRQGAGVSFSGVIYAHQLQVTVGSCVEGLTLACTAFAPEDVANRVEFLPY